MKIFALLLFIWVSGVFLGSTYEGHDIAATWAGTGTGGYDQSPGTTMDYLLNVSNAMQVVSVLGVLPVPVPNSEWFGTLFRILTLRFTFITGDWMMFYWIVLSPLALMGVLSMVLLVYGMLTGNLSWS